jgi:hypothetical protein
VRLATAALMGFIIGGAAAPALSQGTSGKGGEDIPSPAVPGGDVPGGGLPGDRIPEEIRPPVDTGDNLPGSPTVPGRDKLGAPPSMPGENMPSGHQMPSTTGHDMPHTPGAMPGRDKLGTPSTPGR